MRLARPFSLLLLGAAAASASNLRTTTTTTTTTTAVEVVPAAGYATADKAAAAADAAAPAAATTNPQYKGVNLGGWLVLESWMYPEWWKTTGVAPWRGEMQFVGTLGKEKAKELLEKHWDTWVTKDDLKTLKDSGIQHLRVPVGYWLMGDEWIKEGETYLPGGYPYLLRLLGWCKELGLKAIIDLHGAPGSQNGHDNSGFQGGNAAIHWDTPENLKRTTDVLVAMAKNFTEVNKQAAYKDSVLGLCILNEPWTERVMGTIKMDTLKAWIQEATDAIIQAGWKGHIWVPDGFDLVWEGWQGFLQPPKYQNVFMDTHFYLLFDAALGKSNPADLTNFVCQGWNAMQLDRVKGKVASGVVVGEYSMDFAQYPKYPYTPEQLKALQDLLLAQQKQYGVIGQSSNAGVGGFFWSFKSWGNVNNVLDVLPPQNLNSPWDYLAMIKDGVAAKDLAKADFDCPAFVAGYNGKPVQGTPGATTVGGGQ